MSLLQVSTCTTKRVYALVYARLSEALAQCCPSGEATLTAMGCDPHGNPGWLLSRPTFFLRARHDPQRIIDYFAYCESPWRVVRTARNTCGRVSSLDLRWDDKETNPGPSVTARVVLNWAEHAIHSDFMQVSLATLHTAADAALDVLRLSQAVFCLSGAESDHRVADVVALRFLYERHQLLPLNDAALIRLYTTQTGKPPLLCSAYDVFSARLSAGEPLPETLATVRQWHSDRYAFQLRRPDRYDFQFVNDASWVLSAVAAAVRFDPAATDTSVQSHFRTFAAHQFAPWTKTRHHNLLVEFLGFVRRLFQTAQVRRVEVATSAVRETTAVGPSLLGNRNRGGPTGLTVMDLTDREVLFQSTSSSGLAKAVRCIETLHHRLVSLVDHGSGGRGPQTTDDPLRTVVEGTSHAAGSEHPRPPVLPPTPERPNSRFNEPTTTAVAVDECPIPHRRTEPLHPLENGVNVALWGSLDDPS